MRVSWLIILLLCSALCGCNTHTPDRTVDSASSNNPNAPYPPSHLIRSITWHWDTYHTAAPGSDLWPITWGPDDRLYAAWGDGGGFGGTDSDGRVSMGFAAIEGGPLDFRGTNINGGKNP